MAAEQADADSVSADSVGAHAVDGVLAVHTDSLTVRGDSVFKDTTFIGYVVEMEQDDGTSASGGVPPGHCYVILTLEKRNGVWYIIRVRVVYCVPEAPDDPNDGGGGGNEDIDTLAVKFECNPATGVDPGTTVTCTVSTDEPGASFTDLDWSFAATGATLEETDQTSWGGKAVVSGTMVVSGKLNGMEFEPASANVNVMSRRWHWIDHMNVGWRPIECSGVAASWKPAGPLWGAAQPDTCDEDNFFNRGDDSFGVAEGDGPWKGRYYVSARNAPVAVSAQLAPVLTKGGPKHPLAGEPDLIEACGSGVTTANEHKVNTECLNVSGYKTMVRVVTEHEQGHLDDFKKVVEEHDIYAVWDTLVATSETELRRAAKAVADAAHAEMVLLAGVGHPPSYPGWRWWLYRYGSYWEWGKHR